MGGFLSRRDGGNRGNPFKILIFPEISLAFFQNDILLKEIKTEYRSEINQIQRRIMLDKTDKAILRMLQQNARMPNAEIARKIKLAPSAVLKRIQRMEQEKIITGYEAKIDPRALGLGMGSFIKIHADEKLGEVAVGKKIAALPEVQEVHFMAGDFYYLIKVREKDPEAHVSLVRKLGRLGVRDCQTLLILQTVKDTSAIPVYEKDAEK